MKKRLMIILPLFTLLFGCSPTTENFSSINQNDSLSLDSLDQRKLSKATLEVKIEYEFNEARNVFDTNLDFISSPMYEKQNPDKSVTNLIAGDILEIYYDDDRIVDHVLVDIAELIIVEINAMIPPGETEERFDFWSDDEQGVEYNGRDIAYIINSDGSYYPLREHDGATKLYAAYNPLKNEKTPVNTILRKIEALYSFVPR